MSHVSATIKINGKELDDSIRLSNIKLSQPLTGHHHLTMECLSLVSAAEEISTGANTTLDSLRKALGSPIELKMVYLDSSDGGQKLEFKGVVTAIQATRDEDGYSVIIEGHSPTIQLDGAKRNRIWVEKKSSDIISEILGSYSLETTVDATGRTHAHTVQHGETDYEFIQRLSQQEQLWAWYDGEKFKVTKTTDGPSIAGDVGVDLRRFAVKLGTAPGLFHARAWDRTGDSSLAMTTGETSPAGGEHPHVKTAKDVSDEIFKETGDLVLDRHPIDTAGLKADLESHRRGWRGGLVQGEGASETIGATPGGIIEVGGLGDNDGGKYVFTNVTHFLSGESGYYNEFTCVPEDGAAPPRDRIRPHGPTLWGAIVKDTEDPDERGRVQVAFHHSVAASDDIKSEIWLRVAQAHSGDEWGAFVLPEIGDEVIVAALEGDQEDLVIIGSVPNGGSSSAMGAIDAAIEAVGAQDMAQGMAKVFLTKAGNKILIIDKPGEETIEVSSPDGQNKIRMTLDGEPLIEVTTDGAVSVDAKNGITLTSGADIVLDAQGKIDLKSGGDMAVDSKGNVAMEAAMAASVKGGMEATVEGVGKVTCNPAGVEVKGALIRLN